MSAAHAVRDNDMDERVAHYLREVEGRLRALEESIRHIQAERTEIKASLASLANSVAQLQRQIEVTMAARGWTDRVAWLFIGGLVSLAVSGWWSWFGR